MRLDRIPLLLALLSASGAADDILQRPTAAPVRVSLASPFTAGCDAGLAGNRYLNSEVEPWVAVNPKNTSHFVGVWQQDRYADAGARGLMTGVSTDAGRTWTMSAAPFSRCTGGTAANGGDFERVSDPWATFSPDGAVYQIGLAFNRTNGRQGVLVSRSSDGGFTWGPAAALIDETNSQVADDKESITADPYDARYVYAVWDRLTGFNSRNPADFHGPVWFSRTTDSGASWEPARIIFDPGGNAQTIGNQILALPDGTLIDVFMLIANAAAALASQTTMSVALIRSQDKGVTWSDPTVAAISQSIGVADVKTSTSVRTGATLVSAAVDPASGALYLVWEDARFSAGKREGIALARSIDGGLTWTSPVQVNQAPDVQAFTPAVAVGHDGRLAITYYDFRQDTPDPAVLITNYWRITSFDGGETWTEAAQAPPFDLMAAPNSRGLFVGDYEGLAAAGSTIVAFFATGTSSGGNPTDVFAATRPSGADRRHNGHVEVNRVPLRREIERRTERKPEPDRKRRRR